MNNDARARDLEGSLRESRRLWVRVCVSLRVFLTGRERIRQRRRSEQRDDQQMVGKTRKSGSRTETKFWLDVLLRIRKGSRREWMGRPQRRDRDNQRKK